MLKAGDKVVAQQRSGASTFHRFGVVTKVTPKRYYVQHLKSVPGAEKRSAYGIETKVKPSEQQISAKEYIIPKGGDSMYSSGSRLSYSKYEPRKTYKDFLDFGD